MSQPMSSLVLLTARVSTVPQTVLSTLVTVFHEPEDSPATVAEMALEIADPVGEWSS